MTDKIEELDRRIATGWRWALRFTWLPALPLCAGFAFKAPVLIGVALTGWALSLVLFFVVQHSARHRVARYGMPAPGTWTAIRNLKREDEPSVNSVWDTAEPSTD